MIAHLPRSAPSIHGVDSSSILRFLDAVDSAGVDFHSLMVLRNGHVVAEGWWTPYSAEDITLVYSLSKTFTATAVGVAVCEGLLSLDDRVVELFPAETVAGLAAEFAELTVRHLLSMASGHAEDTWPQLEHAGPRIVQKFFSLKPAHAPGTFFCYNQGCTYVLSALITAVTGQRLLDYLIPRLFAPLGIERVFWTQTERGVDDGFSGLHVTTEAIAKLGQLYLQSGQWAGRKILPGAFVTAAGSPQVDTSHARTNPDWQRGYGYQLWACRDGGYRGDGAFGQFCVILPTCDAVIACTAQTTDMQAQFNLIWEHLVPAVARNAEAHPLIDHELALRLEGLSTTVFPVIPDPPTGGTTFRVRSGGCPVYLDGLSEIRVETVGSTTHLTTVIDGSASVFKLDPRRWTDGELTGIYAPLPAVSVRGGWVTPVEFHAAIVSRTSPHRLQLRASKSAQATFSAAWTVPPPLDWKPNLDTAKTLPEYPSLRTASTNDLR